MNVLIRSSRCNRHCAQAQLHWNAGVVAQTLTQSGLLSIGLVFPGGRSDAADSLVPLINAEGLSEAQMAAVVAAHRECFEEAGVWLGRGQPDPQLRDQFNQRSGSLPTDGSLVVDAQRLRQWSRWVTPDTEPKRYDTWFFVCVLNQEEGKRPSLTVFTMVWRRQS